MNFKIACVLIVFGSWLFGLSRAVRGTSARDDYVGCYVDNINRAMGEFVLRDYDWMTIDTCIQQCYNNGALYGGLQAGRACHCGDAGYDIYGRRDDSECSDSCTGDDQETCGGGWRLQVHATGLSIQASSDSVTSKEPTTTSHQRTHSTDRGIEATSEEVISKEQSTASHQQPHSTDRDDYVGCYVDNINRAMGEIVLLDYDWMTIDTCIQQCYNNGALYGGLQYASECYCGDEGYATYGRRDDSECSDSCTGNDQETCGGGWRLQVHATGLSIEATSDSEGTSKELSTSSHQQPHSTDRGLSIEATSDSEGTSKEPSSTSHQPHSTESLPTTTATTVQSATSGERETTGDTTVQVQPTTSGERKTTVKRFQNDVPVIRVGLHRSKNSQSNRRGKPVRSTCSSDSASETKVCRKL